MPLQSLVSLITPSRMLRSYTSFYHLIRYSVRNSKLKKSILAEYMYPVVQKVSCYVYKGSGSDLVSLVNLTLKVDLMLGTCRSGELRFENAIRQIWRSFNPRENL